MTPAAPGKIEIFAPFEAAYELTKRILFQPFDFAKWCTIGFAAFLAGLADGTRGGGNFSLPSDWTDSKSEEITAIEQQIFDWLTAGVIVALVAIVAVIVVLCLWLGSRGRFMFVDCIVRNRGAIAEPWREFRREGNQFFLFMLAGSIVLLSAWAVLALPWLIPLITDSDFPDWGVALIAYTVAVVLVVLLIGLLWSVVLWFMVPVMYRQRCGPVAAFTKVLKLMASRPGAFLLLILFVIVLMIAGAIISCLVTCVTCCIAALPYVGTVILLPLYTFYYAYTLLFLRQFGPEYDAWAAFLPVETAPLAPPPPAASDSVSS